MTSADLSKLRIERGPGAPRRRRGLRWLVALVVIALGAGAFWWRQQNRPPEVELASVVSAWPSQNYALLNATGYVVPQRKAALSSKAQGRLEWLGVLEGSRVRAGEVIARLESRDVRAQLEQAAANLAVARANLGQAEAELVDARAQFERSKDLVAKKFIASSQHDANAARLAKAEAAVGSSRASIASSEAAQRVAEVALSQTEIRAPFDAVVLTKDANVGDNITPFSSAASSKGAVITIADMATLEVEADVSESSIAKIRVGQPAEIQLDALPGKRLAGAVSRIVPTVDRSKATVLVKVRFVERDERVLPDMSAKIAFLEKSVPEGERQPVTAVQPAALVERGGVKLVFTVAEGRARSVRVETGMKVGELIEIRGPVKPGERVVLAPGERLQDGAGVAPAKK